MFKKGNRRIYKNIKEIKWKFKKTWLEKMKIWIKKKTTVEEDERLNKVKKKKKKPKNCQKKKEKKKGC